MKYENKLVSNLHKSKTMTSIDAVSYLVLLHDRLVTADQNYSFTFFYMTISFYCTESINLKDEIKRIYFVRNFRNFCYSYLFLLFIFLFGCIILDSLFLKF